MFKFKPDMYKKDIYEINYEKLQDLGIKYLFFDLDNTIITYKENMPNDKIMTLFFRLEEMGFKLFIFSNSYEKRLLPFKDKLNVEIYFSSMKPFKKNYKNVLNKYKKEDNTNSPIKIEVKNTYKNKWNNTGNTNATKTRCTKMWRWNKTDKSYNGKEN